MRFPLKNLFAAAAVATLTAAPALAEPQETAAGYDAQATEDRLKQADRDCPQNHNACYDLMYEHNKANADLFDTIISETYGNPVPQDILESIDNLVAHEFAQNPSCKTMREVTSGTPITITIRNAFQCQNDATQNAAKILPEIEKHPQWQTLENNIALLEKFAP